MHPVVGRVHVGEVKRLIRVRRVSPDTWKSMYILVFGCGKNKVVDERRHRRDT
jgi:hypothetical protein